MHQLTASIVILFILLTGCTNTAQTASDLKSDETIVFFRTSAWFDNSENLWKIPIHGWVYEPQSSVVRASLFEAALSAKYQIDVSDTQRETFEKRVNLLIADNERGKKIVIRLADDTFALPKTTPNGHFYHIINLTPEEAISHINPANHTIHFRAVLSSSDTREFSGEVKLYPPTGLTVISDIDDTVKRTGVTNTEELMRSTFLLPFSSIAGMSRAYQQMESKGAQFHYVSSSPWQLYPELLSMLNQSDFPWASFTLKSVRFRDKTVFGLFKKGIETKPQQISKLINRYPKRDFILVGDSGEHDPEVYQAIYKEFPGQVKAIWIRDIGSDGQIRERIDAINNAIHPMSIQLFREPESIITYFNQYLSKALAVETETSL